MPMHGRHGWGPVIELHYHIAPCLILLPLIVIRNKERGYGKGGDFKVAAVCRSKQELQKYVQTAEMHVNR